MIKFVEKNQENIDRLNQYIDVNKEDIRMILVSPELFEIFKEYFCSDYHEADEFMEERMKYRGIRMAKDSYMSAKTLYFIRKTESIDFNLPCMCGIYPDEVHP